MDTILFLNQGNQFSLSSFPFLFTSLSSAAAVYRVRGDLWNQVFVLAAYANLMLLFGCVGALQRATEPTKAPSGTLSKKDLRFVLWLLATTLNLGFSYQVTRFMASPLAVAVWSLVVLVTAIGFYVIASCEEEDASPPGPSRKPRRISKRRTKGSGGRRTKRTRD